MRRNSCRSLERSLGHSMRGGGCPLRRAGHHLISSIHLMSLGFIWLCWDLMRITGRGLRRWPGSRLVVISLSLTHLSHCVSHCFSLISLSCCLPFISLSLTLSPSYFSLTLCLSLISFVLCLSSSLSLSYLSFYVSLSSISPSLSHYVYRSSLSHTVSHSSLSLSHSFLTLCLSLLLSYSLTYLCL